jgi:SNF family Na+-dependent transporter
MVSLLVRDAVLICLLHFMWGVMMWLAYVCLVADYQATNQLPKNKTGGPWILFVVFARALAALPHGIIFTMAMYIMVFFVGKYLKIPSQDRITHKLNIII